jgi:hypothetical protein
MQVDRRKTPLKHCAACAMSRVLDLRTGEDCMTDIGFVVAPGMRLMLGGSSHIAAQARGAN